MLIFALIQLLCIGLLTLSSIVIYKIIVSNNHKLTQFEQKLVGFQGEWVYILNSDAYKLSRGVLEGWIETTKNKDGDLFAKALIDKIPHSRVKGFLPEKPIESNLDDLEDLFKEFDQLLNTVPIQTEEQIKT